MNQKNFQNLEVRRNGRPSKFDQEYCGQLEKHMAVGFSFESFAGKIGVARDTLYEWLEKHKSFAESYEKAKMACLLEWERIGIEGTKGLIKSFNWGCWAFNMKNRFRKQWCEPKDEILNEHPESTIQDHVLEQVARIVKLGGC